MKRILLKIAFDGTAYHGWQIQPNAITVQGVLQEALEKLLGVKTGVTGCSRTDAGVHAREFYCHLDCKENIPNAAFLKGLNSLLPKDIAVTDCKQVPKDFHARYDAKGKTYIYRIHNSQEKDPFLSRYSWNIPQMLQIDKMNEFCKKMVGTHDFYAFSSSGRTVEDTIRTVTECFAERQGDIITLKVSANGFLYNMVRIITGTAVDVSLGRVELENIEEIFETKSRDRAGITAPPTGLMLLEVDYNGRV